MMAWCEGGVLGGKGWGFGGKTEHFPSLTHPEFKERILRAGVSFYTTHSKGKS
jgi:hypothetical protein